MNQKEPIFEYLESIAEMIPIPFYWLDTNKKWVGLNKRTIQGIGAKDKNDIIGKTIKETYGDTEISSNLESWITEVLKSKVGSQKETQSMDITTGQYRYWQSAYDPIYNVHNELIGVIGTSIEITAEKEASIAHEEIKKLKYERDLDAIRSDVLKNKIMQEFGVIAAKVAHDINSPLMVANSSLNKIENNSEDLKEALALIKQSLNDIKNISSKILTTYREITGNDSKVKLHKVDDGNIKRYILLSSLLENQIGFKKIEWQNNPCKLELEINEDARNIFAYISPTEFNRSISNLLNNAYESLGIENRNIEINLGVIPDKNNFSLKIKDMGCGIPENKIAHVLSGESTKHKGHGIGLSGAKKYLESIAGNLEINSKINQGTEIMLEFPIAKDPEWFERKINYKNDTKIVVLDDSSTIIMLWQRVLSGLDLKSHYFMDIDDFMKWYEAQQDKENIILFVDYDLGNESFTGLDIVKKIKNIKSYLVTNHSEESWIQEIIQENNYKMLPKKIIEHLKFNSY